MWILPLLQLRVAHETGHLSIVVAESTVFFYLGVAGGIDDAKFGPDDNVRYGRVGLGIAISEVDQSFPRDNILDLRLVAVAIEIVHRRRHLALVFQEDERNVIGLCLVSSRQRDCFETLGGCTRERERERELLTV